MSLCGCYVGGPHNLHFHPQIHSFAVVTIQSSVHWTIFGHTVVTHMLIELLLMSNFLPASVNAWLHVLSDGVGVAGGIRI